MLNAATYVRRYEEKVRHPELKHMDHYQLELIDSSAAHGDMFRLMFRLEWEAAVLAEVVCEWECVEEDNHMQTDRTHPVASNSVIGFPWS